MSHGNGHKTWSLVIKSTKQSNPTLCTEHTLPSLLSTQRVGSKQAQLEQRVEGVFKKAPLNLNVTQPTAVRYTLRR